MIEPAAGVNRTVLSVLMDAYSERQNDKGETRVILKLHPTLAPIKAAILPHGKKQTRKVSRRARQSNARYNRYYAVYDDTGGIGKLYTVRMRLVLHFV